MLSINNSSPHLLLIGAIISLAWSTQASIVPGIPGFESGSYVSNKEQAEGATNMCDEAPVTVSMIKLPEGRWAVKLDGRFSYFVPITAGASRIKSDIDPRCTFVEESTYNQQGNRTTLSKTDSEICDERYGDFSDQTTMIIENDQITLQITDKLGRAPSYKCVYVKKNKK